MRSMKLAAILAMFAASQALGAVEVAPTVLLGGDNRVAEVHGDGLPWPYDDSNATTNDGEIVVNAGELVDWAINVVVTASGGDITNGAANLVIDLELSQGGNPVAIGGIADGCVGTTGSFCSTMNNGGVDSPAGSGNPKLAAFAYSLDVRSYVEDFGGTDPLPLFSGSVIDEVADDGPNMDFFTYPSADGFPTGSTAPQGALVGMGAGYSSYTRPSNNQQLDDGNMAGVGCVGEEAASTCASPNSVGLGAGPLFEGQINTSGLNGIYTLTVNVDVAGNNVLDGNFDPFSTGAVPSFAEASTAGGSDSITFEVLGIPPGNLIYAASRKTHDNGGALVDDYDIELYPNPLVSGSNTVGVESRDGGVVTRLILGFDGPVNFDCNDLAINLGTHQCQGVSDVGGNQYEVALSGGANQSCLEVELVGLNGEIVQAINLYGDVNGSGGVDVIDLSDTKNNALAGVTVITNVFRQDVDLSHGIDVVDLSQIKTPALVGQSASCP